MKRPNPIQICYVLAVYNEFGTLEGMVGALVRHLKDFPNSEVLLSENGSIDQSKELVKKLAAIHSQSKVHYILSEEAGLGVAWRNGLEMAFGGLLKAESDSVAMSRWILLTAADLPFRFSDLESFEEVLQTNADLEVVVGSKSCQGSVVRQSMGRKVASRIFALARTLAIGLETGDPQGTIFIRQDAALRLIAKLDAKDYFLGTQLVYWAEKLGMRIREVPVIYNREVRSSKVKIIRDGLRMLRQLFRLRKQYGRVSRSD